MDSKIEERPNTIFVNCDSFQGKIFKYMPLSRVLEMLREKKITFVYPKLWHDPYEIKYLNTDYHSLKYKQNKIFCLCARMDNTNQEASWRIYSNGREPLFRVSIDTPKLIRCLETFADAHDCNLYVSKINYKHTTKEINELHKPGNPLFQVFFNNMDELKYIKLMSLKRPAFSYENEVRLFLAPKRPDALFDSDMLKVDIDFSIFSRFTIEPCDRIVDEEDLYSRLQRARYDAVKKVAKEAIRELYPEAKIYRSILYSETTAVEQI